MQRFPPVKFYVSLVLHATENPAYTLVLDNLGPSQVPFSIAITPNTVDPGTSGTLVFGPPDESLFTGTIDFV